MTERTGSDPADVRSGDVQGDHFSRYVQRTFRRTLRGYDVADVDEHLRQVRGWFTLAGFDQLLADRRYEILGSALREAETTIEQARREAQTILDEATRRAEATTAAAEQRVASLKTLAMEIVRQIDAQS